MNKKFTEDKWTVDLRQDFPDMEDPTYFSPGIPYDSEGKEIRCECGKACVRAIIGEKESFGQCSECAEKDVCKRKSYE